MLEPLNIDKLRAYGFTESMIERLSDRQNDYECKVAKNQGFFYASNISGFIYSGELGYDKFHNIGIDRFKTFDDMFQRAVEMGSINLHIDPSIPASNKSVVYGNARSYYNIDFNDWLQRFKDWEYGNEGKYKELLTKDIWLEFMTFKAKEDTARSLKREADKAGWKLPQPYQNIQKALAPMIKLENILKSDSYKYFDEDRRNCSEDWQYVEPASMELEDRYDVDKEAYLKTFFDPVHDHEAKFDERLLIERLITNLQKAKHVYFIQYRKLLEDKLKTFDSVESPFTSLLSDFSMQRIIYPNDLEKADSDAAILKEMFKTDVNNGSKEKIYNYLLGLPDLLKDWMKQAKEENPERCKRGLIIIRHEALLWYQLDHIEHSPSNIKLYQLKNELKWYIDETRRVYDSLTTETKEQSKPKEMNIEKPRREGIKERLEKYGFRSFLTDQKKLSSEKITEIEEALLKEELPYCIALLHGLDYLDYFKREYCAGKAGERDKLLAQVFDTIPRRIKGNINVLNPHSTESKTNYTSHQHKESIDKLIKGR